MYYTLSLCSVIQDTHFHHHLIKELPKWCPMNSFQAQWHSNLLDRTLSKLDLLQFPNTKTFIHLWPRRKKYHAITNLRWSLLEKEDNESILLLCQLRRHSSRLVPWSLRTSMLTFWTHIGRWGARGSNQLSTRVGCPCRFWEDGESRSPRELLRVQLYISRSNGSHNWAQVGGILEILLDFILILQILF